MAEISACDLKRGPRTPDLFVRVLRREKNRELSSTVGSLYLPIRAAAACEEQAQVGRRSSVGSGVAGILLDVDPCL